MIDIIYRFVPEFRREQPAPAEKAAAPRTIPFDLRELRIAGDAGEAPAPAPFALCSAVGNDLKMKF